MRHRIVQSGWNSFKMVFVPAVLSIQECLVCVSVKYKMLTSWHVIIMLSANKKNKINCQERFSHLWDSPGAKQQTQEAEKIWATIKKHVFKLRRIKSRICTPATDYCQVVLRYRQVVLLLAQQTQRQLRCFCFPQSHDQQHGTEIWVYSFI